MQVVWNMVPIESLYCFFVLVDFKNIIVGTIIIVIVINIILLVNILIFLPVLRAILHVYFHPFLVYLSQRFVDSHTDGN